MLSPRAKLLPVLSRRKTTTERISGGLRFGGGGAEDVGAKVVPGYGACSRRLDRDAMLRGNWAPTIDPLPNHLRSYADCLCQLALAFDYGYGAFDLGSVHSMTIASLLLACNSIATRQVCQR